MTKYVDFPKEYDYIYCLNVYGATYINLNYTDIECPLKLLICPLKLQLMPGVYQV
jgi:hypothetical protein